MCIPIMSPASTGIGVASVMAVPVGTTSGLAPTS
jgi:hypothetical protein